MIIRNGHVDQLVERRYCRTCSLYTEQVCYNIKYGGSSNARDSVKKILRWSCSNCRDLIEETREVPLLGDKARIISRMLKLREDYAIRDMMISSENEKLIVEIKLR